MSAARCPCPARPTHRPSSSAPTTATSSARPARGPARRVAPRPGRCAEPDADASPRVVAQHGFGAPLPRLENPAQLRLVAAQRTPCWPRPSARGGGRGRHRRGARSGWMVLATSRNSLRMASEVNRGAGSGRLLGCGRPGLAASASSFLANSPSSASAIASSSASSCSCRSPTSWRYRSLNVSSSDRTASTSAVLVPAALRARRAAPRGRRDGPRHVRRARAWSPENDSE